MYLWIVYLHVIVIFIFLIQHAVEIFVTFRLRAQDEPEGIYSTYSFMLDNNSRNLRITYALIIITGITAGFISTWWKQGWMWTALGIMIILWFAMRRIGSNYLTEVDAITDRAVKNRDEVSAIDIFRNDLRARREPEILAITSAIGGALILWLMMFKPF